MVKRLLFYSIIALVLFLTAYYLHAYVVQTSEIKTSFELRDVYLFQAIFSLIIVLTFELLATYTTPFKDQLGFLYLVSMAVKVLFFCIFFRQLLFSSISLSKSDSVSLLIPIFIFLFYEVLIIVKILNRTA